MSYRYLPGNGPIIRLRGASSSGRSGLSGRLPAPGARCRPGAATKAGDPGRGDGSAQRPKAPHFRESIAVPSPPLTSATTGHGGHSAHTHAAPSAQSCRIAAGHRRRHGRGRDRLRTARPEQPVGFQNAALVPDQRFQAAASYSYRFGRRRILPSTGSGTGDVGRGGRSRSARCGRRPLPRCRDASTGGLSGLRRC